MQVKELRDYCYRRGWKIQGEYVDTGWSGAKSSRPQLDMLMKAARLRKFDAVVVWKLDRWGRSIAHLIDSLRELTSLGIRFVAATQNIDTDESNPMARLLLHIMGAFAEFEREIIRERVKCGLEKARADGKDLGRPRVLVDRQHLLKLKESGASIRQICSKTKLSHGTVQRALAATKFQVPPSTISEIERQLQNGKVASIKSLRA